MKKMRYLLYVSSVLVLTLVLCGQLLPKRLRSVSADEEKESIHGRIFFVDIGQGAGTLIVSPTGQTLLVDGGPGGGGTKIANLLNTLNIATINYTIVTHYHIDHVTGITELLNAGRVNGIAFDNGDGDDVRPPNPGGTQTAYNNYVAATSRPGVTRQTIQPGQVIDLGGGMRVTCLVAGGRLLSGGQLGISTADLNSQSISVLIEYGNFDYLVSGDLTGGGSTATSRGPDLETFMGQLAGDVDVFQMNHHGSITSNNQRLLSAVKAETAIAQAGESNTFGHPNKEVANRFLWTPTTSGATFTGTGQPTPGTAPVFYQTQSSPSGDTRVTQQGYAGAGPGSGGLGTLMIQTDGTTNYSFTSFDDGGVRINPALHTYPVDSASAGVTNNFKPNVIPSYSPAVPLSTEPVTVSARVNDREDAITSVTLNYSLNGTAQPPVNMTLSGEVYTATIPAQPNATRVDFTVTAVAGGQSTSYSDGYFSGLTPISTLRVLNSKGEPMYAGYAARIQGVVTAGTDIFSSSAANDDYVEDASGGINVFRTQQPSNPPIQQTVTGQTVEVRGLISSNEGRFRLEVTPPFESPTTPYGITILSTGSAPTPIVRTIAQLNADPESFEGELIQINNAQVTSGTIPSPPVSLNAFLTVSDGTGTFTMKIDKDTTIPGMATPSGPFTLIGIIQQDDPLRPFNSDYNIAPRSRVDLGSSDPSTNPIPIADARVDEVDNSTGTTPSDYIPDLLNQQVKVRGVVTSIDFRGTAGLQYFIQDPTGGISLFNSTNSTTLNIGDNVEVLGTIVQFNGLTQLDPGASGGITLLSPGTLPAVTPQVITLSQLANGGVGEAIEGRLIRVNNCVIVSGTIPPAGSDGNLTISDGTGQVVMRIDRDTNIDGTPTPTGTFQLTGLAGQFDTTNPFDADYQILPNSTADIVVSSSSISASPANVSFGSVTVGMSSNQTVTITNNSAGTVTLTPPFNITGTDANQFSVGAPGTTSLAPSASTTVQVTFTPTSTGNKTASLTITSSGGNAVVVLSGTGQSAALTVNPSSVNFGNVVTGTSSNVSLNIINNTAGTVTLTPPFNITGTNANQFSVGAPGTTSLAPSASTTVVVTFSPTSNGVKTASLAITSSVGTVNVPLSGTGVVASVATLPFSQNWSDISLITANDDWSGVTAIVGKRGDNLTVANDVDPQTVLAGDDPGVIDVNANQTNPNTNTTGGVTEFHITNPVVALQGSGTADAPYLLISINTTGANNIQMTYNLRDIDGSSDNAVQQVALQYRVGNSGSFTNIPAGYVADATTGPNLATLVTPVNVTLPAACNNQPLVQLRIITTNATGNDEWVGIDDINIFEVTGPTLSINDVSLSEGNSGTTNFNFTVSLSAPVAQPVTVDFATAGSSATSGVDFIANSGTVTFPANNNTPQTVTVQVVGDINFEQNEVFFVNLSNAVNATIMDAQGSGTINNDDSQPSISIGDVSVAEGNSGTTNATFTVTLSATSFQNISVNYATANGTATAGSDYTATSGTATIPAGFTSQTFNVSITGDNVFEPDETFLVNLTSPVNATISDNQAIGTILNDDPDPGATANLTVYVADAGNHRIQRTTDDGATWTAVGLGQGTTVGRFYNPRGVAASSNDQIIFVADTGNNRIQRSTDGGLTWQVVALSGTAVGRVYQPWDVAYDQVNDLLYVADTGANRIQVATNASTASTLTFTIFAGATAGTTVGKVSQPKGIAVSKDGVVYVADTNNNRIQVYNGTWSIFAGATAGTAVGKFNKPAGVFVDRLDRVFVADTGNNRIQYNIGGVWTALFTAGTGVGFVRLPEGVMITGSDNIFVADTLNNRIQRKPLAGGSATIIGPTGNTVGRFNTPSGIR